MRLRYVEGQYDFVREHPKGIVEPREFERDIKNEFGNDNPIHVELGCGKGQFIRNMAKLNPDINFLGFEKSIKVAYRCVKSIQVEDPDNFRIVYSNGDILADLFPETSIERIYLNFSDPWPKPGHYKRRLTHKNFLDIYEKVLVQNGEVHMKTDNDDLFEFSAYQFSECGWEMLFITENLHASKGNKDNVMTEYEEKFAGLGKTINKLIARKR